MSLKINIKTIPHSHHRYKGTVGDYFADKKGIEQVRVSKMSNWRYEYLVAIHELIEDFLCQHRGIKESDITRFDKQFEREREKGLHSPEAECGDSMDAPYFIEHQFATKIEKMLAEQLGVSWEKYSNEIITL
jgi:hypothetical protein